MLKVTNPSACPWTRLSSSHSAHPTKQVCFSHKLSISVSVYYVAVRIIVLSCHRSNLPRPVIIHDIIHSLIYVPSTHIVDFLVSRRMETAPTSIEVLLRPALGQSDEPSDLHGSLSPTGLYSTWQSQAVTHPIINRARRCLTSVIEPTLMSKRSLDLIHTHQSIVLLVLI